jgi:hypothetical protein
MMYSGVRSSQAKVILKGKKTISEIFENGSFAISRKDPPSDKTSAQPA